MSLWLSAFATLSLLLACESRPYVPPDESPPVTVDASPAEAASGVEMVIYLDGTESMQGFAEPRGETTYAHVLRALGSTSVRGRRPSPTVYKFGRTAKGLTKLSNVLAALEASAFYYTGKHDENITELQNIIGLHEAPGLSVVATDLHQDQGLLDPVVDSLRESVFNKGHAFGLVAVRSDFNGKLFDVARHAAGEPYHGERALYVLVLGPTEEVFEYCRRLWEELGGDATRAGAPKYAVFAPSVVGSTVRTWDIKQGDKQNLVSNGELQSIRWWRWDDPNAPAELTLTIHPDWTRDVPVSMLAVGVETRDFPAQTARAGARGVDISALARKAVDPVRAMWRRVRRKHDASGSAAAEADDASRKPREFKLVADVQQSVATMDARGVCSLTVAVPSMPPGIYGVFRVQVIAQPPGSPPWVKDWSFGDREVLQDSAAAVSNVDAWGSRTRNLDKLCREVVAQLAESPAPGGRTVADLRWVIERR